MFHYPIHLTAVFLFLQSLTLVKLLLTLTEGNIHLRTTFLIDEYQQGYDGIARLLRGTGQLTDLTFGEQQLTVALHIMVVVGTIEIRANVHTLYPQLTIDDGAIGIHQTGLAQTDTLDLRTRQHDACREGLDEEVFKRSLLVFYLYRTLLPDLFFCLVQFS